MAAALANIAKSASSMVGSSGPSKSPAEDKYTLLESVNVEENIKNIGDEILKTFAKERMQGIDQIKSNPEDFKKQIRKDLIYIYYKHGGKNSYGKYPVIFKPDSLRDDIKEKILSSWYAALDLRKNDIINNGLKYLLENHDKIIPKSSSNKGGGLTSALSGLGGKLAGLKGKVTGDTKIQKDILKKMGSDNPNEQEGEQNTQIQGNDTPERGDEFYFKKLVEYKTQLFSENVIKIKKTKYYASGSQAVKLHNRILYKVIRHYSGIPRKYLSTTLRRIILGDDAIGYISQYKTKKKYTPSPNKVIGIYDLFIAQITNLKDGEIAYVITLPGNPKETEQYELPEGGEFNGNYSYSVNGVNYDNVSYEKYHLYNHEKIPHFIKNRSSGLLFYRQINYGGGGDDKKIPNYMPTSYVWTKIKSHVQQDYRKLIKTNLEPLSEHIKEAFKDVFRVVNCDALTFFTSDDDQLNAARMMNEHLQNDFNKILELLCEKMPDNFAVNILQNYIKKNTDNFIQFLTGNVFQVKSSNANTANNFQSFVDAFLKHKSLQPELPPFFNFDKKFKGKNVEIDTYVDKLEACCKKGISNEDRNPYENNVPEIITGKEGAIHLAQSEGLPGFFESLMAPSSEKQYIELPVFELFKEQFMQCSDDVDLLAELFNMYSSRSIQFMQKVQMRFYVENAPMNAYIIKFILTKHKYTTKIISECIRHAADKKLSLTNKIPQLQPLDIPLDIQIYEYEYATGMSKYATFLIFCVSKTSLKNSKPDTGDSYYITLLNQVTEENDGIIINYISQYLNDNIIKEFVLTEKDKQKYNSELTKLFALNDTIQPPPIIIQDATDLPVMKVESSSLLNQANPSGNFTSGPVHGADVYSQNTTQENSNLNAAESTLQTGLNWFENVGRVDRIANEGVTIGDVDRSKDLNRGINSVLGFGRVLTSGLGQ